MPPVPLSLKIIKDEVREVEGQPRPRQPQIRVLRAAFLPLHVYVRIETPLPVTDEVRESNDRLGLHLIGVPSPANVPNNFLGVAGIPPPMEAEPKRLRMRRMLVLLSHAEAQNGRYRVVLIRHGKHLASAEIVKRSLEVRLLTKISVGPPRYVAPVLISGTPKSGTTWLEKVINAHPEFLVLHEANTLNILDGDMLRDQLESRSDFFRSRYIPWMPLPYDAADFSRLLQIGVARDLMTRFGHAWGANFVADRTPGYAPRYSYLPDLWEDLRIVHIVRHPLDVMTSWLFHEVNAGRDKTRSLHLPRAAVDRLNARLDAGETVETGEFLSDSEMAEGAFNYFARRWRREQDLVLAAAERNPEQFHRLTYEDLSRDFGGTASALFAFFGTDPACTDIARIERDSSFRTLSGGREQGQASVRSFFRKGVVGDWRNVFTAYQAGLIWNELASAASAFGYSMD